MPDRLDHDLAGLAESVLIAIDGKTLRRSDNPADGKAALHMVSAWCQANRLVLGRLATDEKSNEILAELAGAAEHRLHPNPPHHAGGGRADFRRTPL